jgi:cytochrome c oxidase subunit 2
MSPTDIFTPASSAARSVFDLSLMVYAISGMIFLAVVGLIAYSLFKFRKKRVDNGREPPQVYGSKHVELAWTIIPILIVLVLFMASARVIYAMQEPTARGDDLEVNVVAHQFWWEYRYPQLGLVTANELHVPASNPQHPTRVLLHLYSADAVHSFWVPRLAGKTDLIPNFPNTMWFDPEQPGLYLGQCAQYCGAQHAKMLLRVYVEPRRDFELWADAQKRPVGESLAVAKGRELFEKTACMNCHTIAGSVAGGRFGPDLTHLMSRDTLASGVVPNTRENLRRWIERPDTFKPASLMPALGFSDSELDAVTDYLMTLR